MAAESNAKNASSAGMPQAVRISSEMAMVPLVGSACDDGAATGCVAVIPRLEGAFAAGGLAEAQAPTSSSGAIERTKADERTACEMVFMALTSVIV
jgi:hypothetical protein